MAFIPEVSEAQAPPELKKLYQTIRNGMGFLPNYFTAIGRSPKFVETHLSFNEAIMADGALPQKIKEQIGLVVSGINTSSYCVALHMEFLRQMGIEKPVGRKLATDYRNAPVEDRVKALFRFADKLTRDAENVSEQDVAALRAAGWSDDQIFETVVAASYFNFINRVSIGLGLVADF